MIRKGKVSTPNNVARKAEIFFPDLDDGVTALLPMGASVPSLYANDLVAVAFFSCNITDGVILDRIGGGAE